MSGGFQSLHAMVHKKSSAEGVFGAKLYLSLKLSLRLRPSLARHFRDNAVLDTWEVTSGEIIDKLAIRSTPCKNLGCR